MKKLVLVMVSALIIIMFIAFNYILWDSQNKEKDIENLKYLNINNNSRISAFERDIKALEDEVKQYKRQIDIVDTENKKLKEDKLKLENERLELMVLYEHKLELINILKKNTDLTAIEEPIKNWVEAIYDKDYDTAYNLLKAQRANQYEPPTLEEFKNNYKATIKEISLKSIKHVIEDIPNDLKGTFVLETTIVTNMNEIEEKNIDGFEEGENKRFILVDYEREGGNWVITGISNTL